MVIEKEVLVTLKKIMIMSAALLLAFALAAEPLERFREEQAPLIRVLESDGVVFAWDQAVVLNMNVEGRPTTSINLSGALEGRENVMATLAALGERDAVKPVMLGVMLDADKLTEKSAEITMVGWSFLESKVVAIAMTTGTAMVAPSAMSPKEAEALFKAHLPQTLAYLQKQSAGK